MSYCVLIKVSKLMVSFWYQTEGSPYAALSIRESNCIPLYFYVDGNDFFFGNLAKERFYKNDPHAFGNYFEIIKDPSIHFNIYGNKKPVKQLFYHGVEQLLSHFINTVLYKSDSVESYRHFPLRFVFDADIEDQEKVLIEALFTDAGYYNVMRVDFTQALFAVLTKARVIQTDSPILLLRSMGNRLFMHLYKNGFSNQPATMQLDGQGADARVKILAEMILEYVITSNPSLTIDQRNEFSGILPYCKSLLDHETAIISGEAELRDGNKYWFKITSRNLHERLKYYTNDLSVYATIADLLKFNGVNSDDVTLVLGSEELNTPYFLEKLLKKYTKVKAVEPVHLKDTMAYLFSFMPIPSTVPRAPLPPPSRKEMPAIPKKIALPPLPPKILTSEPVKKITLPPLPPKKNK